METSKETQQALLRDLSKHGGWSILELKINEQLLILRNQLENNPDVNVSGNQNQIKAYRNIVRWVDEAKGRKKNATETE